MFSFDPDTVSLTLANAMKTEHPVLIKSKDAKFLLGMWEAEYNRFPLPEDVVNLYEETMEKPFFLPFCAGVWRDIERIASHGGEYYCNKYVACACLALRNPKMQADVLRVLSMKESPDD